MAQVKERASFIFWFSFHFSRVQNRKSLSTVYFCSETKRKRLLRRLVRERLRITELLKRLRSASVIEERINQPKQFHCTAIPYTMYHAMLNCSTSLARSRALWVRKFSYLCTREILVVTCAYVCPLPLPARSSAP